MPGSITIRSTPRLRASSTRRSKWLRSSGIGSPSSSTSVICADVRSRHVTQDKCCLVFSNQVEDLDLSRRAGEVDHPGTGGEPGPGDLRLVRLDRHQDPLAGQLADDGDEDLVLALGVDPGRSRGARLRADVDEVGTLGGLHATLADGRLGRGGDALPVRRVAGQVDRAHHRRSGVDVEDPLPHQQGRDRRRRLVAVPLEQAGQRLEGDHRLPPGRRPGATYRV